MYSTLNLQLTLLLVLSLNFVQGQILGQNYRKPIPYAPLIERDVMWNKRVWRTMDLKEKMNHPFYYPIESYGNMNSLFSTIKKSIENNELSVYDAVNEEFTITLETRTALSIGESTETVYFDNEDNELDSVVIITAIESENIMRFRIKEDWFFDRQRSVLETRIIGICPVAEVMDENGDYKGELPMYWVYFPEIRPLLALQQTVNRWNDAEQRSYDELFSMRFFSSYIYKESNVYNRRIADYKIDLDALLENQAITNKIFDFEQDLWEY